MIESNSSNNQSTKDKFEIALKIREDNSNSKKMKTKATKPKKAKSMTQMKKDIDYSTVLQTKDNTKESTTSGSSSAGRAKSKLFSLCLAYNTKIHSWLI